MNHIFLEEEEDRYCFKNVVTSTYAFAIASEN